MSVLLSQLGEIAYFVVLPILLMAGIGWVLQRSLGLDLTTLTRLNFYFVIPAMVYFAVVTSVQSVSAIGTVIGFSVLFMAVLSGVAIALAAIFGVPRDMWRALVLADLSYNSGNYGLPLQELAWRSRGLSDAAVGLQVFVMLTQNLFNFTLGVVIAAGPRKGEFVKHLKQILRLPPIYALVAALLTVALRSRIDSESQDWVVEALGPFWDTIKYVKSAFVAVALCTLGAQLGALQPGEGHRPLLVSVPVRLVVGPLLAFGLLHAMGMHGLVAQVLLISTSTPTAVNCMLICMEFDNHPQFVARSVFYSTLLSPVTVTLAILLAHSGGLGS